MTSSSVNFMYFEVDFIPSTMYMQLLVSSSDMSKALPI